MSSSPLGEIVLRGRSHPTPIYALHGTAARAGAAFADFLERHKAALTAFATEAPDAAAKIRAAREHPCGEAYATFYARLGEGHSGLPAPGRV